MKKLFILDEIKENPLINTYLKQADDVMSAMGYTEHGLRHANLTANIAKNILEYWMCEPKEIELAGIAAYLHDIGNCISRTNHSQIGALLAFNLLNELKIEPLNITQIIGAIGNHEETEFGEPISLISASVILADKTDVHRSRLPNPDKANFDIHDRVNYSTLNSFLRVNKKEKIITLELTIDTSIGSIMEYFEIFLERMKICRRAANFMGANFKLEINQNKIL
ncbi:MAG: HD domain-containing protein [Armatimonadetes bacterium]|nr:HD domain-containing protein [Armatimonadota bacterium]